VDINVRPWSVINLEPVPCRVTIWVTYTVAHVSVVWSGMGGTSTYFAKLFMNVSSYLFLGGVSKYGPVTSMDVTSKGDVGSSTSPSWATNSLSSRLGTGHIC